MRLGRTVPKVGSRRLVSKVPRLSTRLSDMDRLGWWRLVRIVVSEVGSTCTVSHDRAMSCVRCTFNIGWAGCVGVTCRPADRDRSVNFNGLEETQTDNVNPTFTESRHRGVCACRLNNVSESNN